LLPQPGHGSHGGEGADATAGPNPSVDDDGEPIWSGTSEIPKRIIAGELGTLE
jgi:hypothetical protein